MSTAGGIDLKLTHDDAWDQERFGQHLVLAATTEGCTASQVAGVITVTHRYTPGWAKALAIAGILLSILNLSLVTNFVAILWAALALALFAKRHDSISVTVDTSDRSVRLRGAGSSTLARVLIAAGLESQEINALAAQPARVVRPMDYWRPAALATLLAGAALAGYLLFNSRDSQPPDFSYGVDGQVERSVARKTGARVDCESVGWISLGDRSSEGVTRAPAYRCEGDGHDQCWLIADSNNLSGAGIRRLRAGDEGEAVKACPAAVEP